MNHLTNSSASEMAPENAGRPHHLVSASEDVGARAGPFEEEEEEDAGRPPVSRLWRAAGAQSAWFPHRWAPRCGCPLAAAGGTAGASGERLSGTLSRPLPAAMAGARSPTAGCPPGRAPARVWLWMALGLPCLWFLPGPGTVACGAGGAGPPGPERPGSRAGWPTRVLVAAGWPQGLGDSQQLRAGSSRPGPLAGVSAGCSRQGGWGAWAGLAPVPPP